MSSFRELKQQKYTVEEQEKYKKEAGATFQL